MSSEYHAVSIRHSGRCCQAVKALEEERYLSSEAPILPLQDCTLPGQCQCRYKHYRDRRDDPRRDEDIGLPQRSYFGLNRRSRTGRRTTDAA